MTSLTGLLNTSTVQITVNPVAAAPPLPPPGVHPPPSVTTGANQTITLPTSSVTVTSAPVVTGSLASTSWTKFPYNQAKITVGILGSSTALGAYNSVDSSFVERLRNYWVAQGIVDQVINLANTGSDIGAGLPTGVTPMPGLSAPDPLRNVTALIAAGVKVAIVGFPTNAYDQDIVTPTVVGQEAQVIYDALKAAGIQCYVTTSQSRDDFSPTAQAKMKVIRDTIMNRFGYHAIDFYTGLTNAGLNTQIAEYARGDGIHFNDLGHQRLFEIVKAKNIFQDFVTNPSVITSPAAGSSTITGLTQGVYKYVVGIMDANGLAASAVTGCGRLV